nr:PucR family transcriptional regulator ligand-binding domain-containing protein [Priestia koreensis]
MSFYLTIEEVLQRKHFSCSEVVAGGNGLHRFIKWVHVMEVTEVKSLLRGHELILSTGIGWGGNLDHLRYFVQQLIDIDAAGLCIELGPYMPDIPDEIKGMADAYGFPIIVFHKEVPFIEITQDLHALLVNQHYETISKLENYSQNLQKLMLDVHDVEPILDFLHQHTNVQVVMKLHSGAIYCAPDLPFLSKQNLLRTLDEKDDHPSVIQQSIQVLQKEHARLYVIFPSARYRSELELLLLDRTAVALAQQFLRELYVTEKKQVHETEWMRRWLEQDLTKEDIYYYIGESSSKSKIKGVTIAVCTYEYASEQQDLDLVYLQLLLRNTFEQQGFRLFITVYKNQAVCILLNQREGKTLKKRIMDGFMRFLSNDYKRIPKLAVESIGVGQHVEKLEDIHKSYETAIETLRIQQQLCSEECIHFYEELHMYRIISLVQQHRDLRDVIMEYLAPVLEYDQQFNTKLLDTLKVYLACNGSKKETAKQLFVVRQTLYHRIEKLERLLGSDFMESEKRMAIEFMLKAYDYLFGQRTSEKISYEL